MLKLDSLYVLNGKFQVVGGRAFRPLNKEERKELLRALECLINESDDETEDDLPPLPRIYDQTTGPERVELGWGSPPRLPK